MKPCNSDSFTFFGYPFEKSSKSLYMPTMSGIVINSLGREYNTTEKFLLDTGSAISLLSDKYSEFFDYAPCDTLKVQYANGPLKRISIFNAFLQIKGKKYPIKFGIDKDLKTNCLIGNCEFLDQYRSISLAFKSRKIYFY